MSDVSDPLAWSERAEEDYQVARSVLRRRKPLRYPGDDPTLEEAREAVEIAKSVRRFVRKLLGVR